MSKELILRVIKNIETLGTGPKEGEFAEDSFLVAHGLAELYTSILNGSPNEHALLEYIGEILLISWKVHMKMMKIEDQTMENKNWT